MTEKKPEAPSGKSGARDARPLAVVTGASAGIGKAFAERLARDGYDLLIAARRRQRLERLAEQLRARRGVRVEVCEADLARSADVDRMAARIAQADSLELLVNNAGFGTQGPFASLDPTREEEEIRLNVLALVRLTRAVLPEMLARGRGGIVNVSSLAGLTPGPFTATYAATKAYVNSFGESLFEELRGTGVRVVTLLPGFTRTEFQEVAGIDARFVPGFAWMEPEPVVASALDALGKGECFAVPGLTNQALSRASQVVPRALLRRAWAGILRARGASELPGA